MAICVEEEVLFISKLLDFPWSFKVFARSNQSAVFVVDYIYVVDGALVVATIWNICSSSNDCYSASYCSTTCNNVLNLLGYS